MIQARKLSVHAGLNLTTVGAPELRGCVRDVERLQALAAVEGFERFAFLTDLNATADNLLTAVEDACADAGHGGHVLFNFSGHGYPELDINGDEADGFDENLLCADRGISDDEIYAAVSTNLHPSARCTLLVDACHTGTIGREGRVSPAAMAARLGASLVAALPGPPPPPRLLPFDVASRLPRTPQPVLPDFGGAIVQFSACRDDETAGDEGPETDGGAGGTFTKAFLSAWDARVGCQDWRTFSREVQSRAGRRQHPSLKTIRGRHLLAGRPLA